MNTIDSVIVAGSLLVICAALAKAYLTGKRASQAGPAAEPADVPPVLRPRRSAGSKVGALLVLLFGIGLLLATFLGDRETATEQRAAAERIQANIEAQTVQITRLEKDRGAAVAKVAAFEGEVKSLRADLANVDAVKADAVDLRAKLAALQGEFENTKTQLDAARQQNQELRRTADEKAAAADEAEKALDALKGAMKKAAIQIDGNDVKFNDAVLFGSGRHDIDCSRKDVMAKLIAYLEFRLAHGINTIRIVGHTDNTWGGITDPDVVARNNLELSLQRAESVKAYLAEAGIQAQALHAEGRGLTQPVGFDAPLTDPQKIKDANNTDNRRTQNRRVEIRLSTE